MTRYALVHEGTRVLVVPENRIGSRRVNCFYLGHIEGAWKLAEAIERDSFGRPKSLRGSAVRTRGPAE